MYIHAMACTLSKLDMQLRDGQEGEEFERDRAAALHFLELGELEVRRAWRELRQNADISMRTAADAAIAHNNTLPNSDFHIPESSPNAKGTGRGVDQSQFKQFPGDGFEVANQQQRRDSLTT